MIADTFCVNGAGGGESLPLPAKYSLDVLSVVLKMKRLVTALVFVIATSVCAFAQARFATAQQKEKLPRRL
jgi:hypothetical protein